MKEVKVTKYEAEDGEIFSTQTECEEYEKALKARHKKESEYEVTYEVCAIIKLDGIILKRKVKTSAKPNYDYGSEFRIAACNALWDTENEETAEETAEELLKIAVNQNIRPCLDYFESESLCGHIKIE